MELFEYALISVFQAKIGGVIGELSKIVRQNWRDIEDEKDMNWERRYSS